MNICSLSVFLVLTMGGGGCKSTSSRETPKEPPLSSSRTKSVVGETAEAGPGSETATPPAAHQAPIDPSLTIDNLLVNTNTYQGLKMPLGTIDFSQPADYFEYQACADELTCPKGTSPSKSFVIPGLAAGTYKLQVRACRYERTDTTGQVVCGPWLIREYVQEANPDDRGGTISTLLSKKAELENQIKNLGLDLYIALDTFQEHVAWCHDTRVTSLIAPEVVDKFLALGPGLLGVNLCDPNMQLVLHAKSGEMMVVLPSADSSANSQESGKGTSNNAHNNGGGSSNDSEAQNVSATVSTVAGVGFLRTNMLRDTAKDRAQAKGHEMSGAAGKKLAAEYDKIAAQHETASTAFKVIAVGSLLFYISQTDGLDPRTFVQQFLNNAALTEVPSDCQSSALAVAKIFDIDKQARDLRTRIASIVHSIDTLNPSADKAKN